MIANGPMSFGVDGSSSLLLRPVIASTYLGFPSSVL